MFAKNSKQMIQYFFKKFFYYLFLGTLSITYGQQLNRQMLAAQGSSFAIKDGIQVSQSVGQLSVIGNSVQDRLTVQQGFQQSLVRKNLVFNETKAISASVYPNPFSNVFSVGFSQPINEELTVTLYNILGELLHKEFIKSPQNIMTFYFDYLPSGTYVLQIQSKNHFFSKKIIKQ
jgi:hypothetical protein